VIATNDVRFGQAKATQTFRTLSCAKSLKMFAKKIRTLWWEYRAPEKNGIKRTPRPEAVAAKVQRFVDEAALIQRGSRWLWAARE
jgi:hypothetical protein